LKKLNIDFLKLEKFKKKEKRSKPAKPKIITKQQADMMTLSIVGLIVVIFLSGVIRMFTMVNTVGGLQAEIAMLRADIRTSAYQEEMLDVVLATHVLDEFVPLWMNVDLSADGWVDELGQFVGFDLATIRDGIHHDTVRSLHEFELVGMRDMGRFNLATYHVSYHVVAGEGDDPIPMRLALHVPFLIIDGSVSVISLPYFTQIASAIGGVSVPQMNIDNDASEEMVDTRLSIEEFLPVFFEMYAESDERSLELFMDDPVLMGGDFELEAVHLSEARLTYVGDDVMVQVMVTFRDGGTDFVHQAPFTLLLESQANSWFIREMHHLFIN
jgi:hypothetical protein